MALRPRHAPSPPQRSELAATLLSYRRAFVGIGAISGVVNILALTGPFFMLQVYDRVIPSHSVSTLVGLAILVLGLFAFQAALEMVRGRVVTRIGVALDAAVSPRIYRAIVELPLRMRMGGDGLEPVRDLDAVRSFISGTGPLAFFDLPWMPLYLGICFLFHPLIGVTALIGALILGGLAGLTEVLSRAPIRTASRFAATRSQLAEESRRNAEVLRAMGLGPAMADRWAEANSRYLAAQARAGDVTGGLGALSRTFRLILQSTLLAVGAVLVIRQEASAGIMIASSIMMTRALAPAELAIANWRGFIAARFSWSRLAALLAAIPAEKEPLPLSAPVAALTLEGVALVPPGASEPNVRGVTLALKAGDGLGIIGPAASGKSSLARAMVGIWPPAIGQVRLDGATLDQWKPEILGRSIGYLPQAVDLLAGTIAENIARFRPDADPAAIVAAAKTAGVHDLIVRLKSGYDTPVGEGGSGLSAGQRQRVALARALYGDPFLVVLDEPNSNLDADGEIALAQAIASVRKRGGIAVVIAHRPSVLEVLNKVLVMAEGSVRAFGAKEDVLPRVLRKEPAPQPAAAPLRVVAGQEPVR
jgi:ATP-binding cassette subfamily C protein